MLHFVDTDTLNIHRALEPFEHIFTSSPLPLGLLCVSISLFLSSSARRDRSEWEI